VYEVASVPVDTVVVVSETAAFLGLILGVVFVVLPELIEPVGELASFVIGTVPIIHVFFAELGFLFVWLAFS